MAGARCPERCRPKGRVPWGHDNGYRASYIYSACRCHRRRPGNLPRAILYCPTRPRSELSRILAASVYKKRIPASDFLSSHEITVASGIIIFRDQRTVSNDLYWGREDLASTLGPLILFRYKRHQFRTQRTGHKYHAPAGRHRQMKMGYL